MRVPLRNPCATAFLAVLVLGLAGCADVERAGAADTADSFAAAVRDDPASGCPLLGPATLRTLEEETGAPCAEALPAAGVGDPGARRGVSVAGHAAQARFAQDTYVLALFDDGWKVVAAGCERSSADVTEPYDCAVDGG